jgi:Gas vesicle synthesis protein GvpL/GvpF
VSEGGNAVYVYGVVAAAEAAEITATGARGDQGAVRTVEHEEIAAVVTDVPRGPLVAAKELRSHWRVLEEAASRTTVLPVRFGTVLDSDQAVRDDFLAPQQERLRALLAELAGKVQLTVKGFYEEERLLREVVAGSPEVSRLRARVSTLSDAAGYYERIRLGELVAAEVERRRERDSALVLERLAPLAVAARREPPATPDAAVNAAFLVKRSKVDEFSRAVAELTAEVEERMRIRYVGPLPPYSFAGDEAAAGSGAWA